jgi:hypothetical protein
MYIPSAVNYTVGIPTVADFATRYGRGPAFCIDSLTGIGYYLAPGDIVSQLVGGSSGQFPTPQDYGAVGDGTTDDTVAIQAAIDANITATGGLLYFPDATYKITSKLVIPFSAGWQMFGESRDGARIKQFSNNTRIFSFETINTHSWLIENFTLEWDTQQTTADTQSVAIFMGSGVASAEGFYHWRVRHCLFNKGFRSVAGDPANSSSLWGCTIEDCWHYLTMTGALFYSYPSPAVGQPCIAIRDNLIQANNAGESSIQVLAADEITISNNEFLSGTASAMGALVTLTTCAPVLFENNKSEDFTVGAAGNAPVFQFPNSRVIAINTSVIMINGSGAIARALKAGTSGTLSVHGFYGTTNMTGGALLVYEATELPYVGGIVLNQLGTGHARQDIRSYDGAVPVPKINADYNQPEYITDIGDASTTLTSTSDKLQYQNVTLTANRTITLPIAGLYEGMLFHIMRNAVTPGAFTYQVVDTVNGNNYLFPSSTNGYVIYRLKNNVWRIVQSGLVAPSVPFTDGDKGDITVSGGGATWAIDADVVSNTKLANVASATFKGRVTAAVGDPEDLTGTQATTLLDTFTSALKGLVPPSGGGTVNFARADGTWAVPPGSGGIADGDKGDITVSGGGTVWTIDAGVVTLAKQADMATASVVYRKTAGSGAPEVQTLATLKTDLGLTGTNSGDQTSIVGITGTLAEFNTALTGADFATGGGTATGTNTGDQTTITGNAGTATALQTPRNISITGKATAAGGNFDGTAALALNVTAVTLVAGDIPTIAQSQVTNLVTDLAAKQPLDTQLTDLAGLVYAGNALKVVRVNAGATGWELAAGGGGGGTTITSGITAVDFGAFPGASDTSLTITGQAGIVAGSVVKAYIIATATVDHSADEHWVETIEVKAGNIVAGVGFTIYAKNTNQLSEPVLEQWADTRLAGPGTGMNQVRPDLGGGKAPRLYGLFTVAWEWF